MKFKFRLAAFCPDLNLAHPFGEISVRIFKHDQFRNMATVDHKMNGGRLYKTCPLNRQDQICTTMFPSTSNDDAVIIPRPKHRSSIFDDFVRVQRHSFDIVIFSNVVKDAVKVAWYVFIRLSGSCIDPPHYYKASSV